MSYGTVKTQFMSILNRRDVTPTQVDTFMKFAIQRIHVELRLPAMERVVALETNGSCVLDVPGDLLQFISIYTNDTESNSSKLTRTDLSTILVKSAEAGYPEFYHREDSNIYVGPCPPSGTFIYIHYYSDSSSLVLDTDTNWLTEVSPTLLIYCALSFAADFFLDDRRMLFEDRYIQLRDSLNIMAKEDEVENASIRPSFNIG